MRATLKSKKIYLNEKKADELLIEILEKELENLLNDMYNQSQADTVINDERLVA